jgi:hypothetical protein
LGASVTLSVALGIYFGGLSGLQFEGHADNERIERAHPPVVTGDKELMIAGPGPLPGTLSADAPFTFVSNGSLNTARTDHRALTGVDNSATIPDGGLPLAPLASAA